MKRRRFLKFANNKYTKEVCINVDNILYLERDGKHTDIHLVGGEILTVPEFCDTVYSMIMELNDPLGDEEELVGSL